MYRKKILYCFGVLAAGSCLFTGCGPAELVNPLFEESERILLPGLPGIWLEQKSENQEEDALIFEEKEDQSYEFCFRMGKEAKSYKGFAGRIGADYYFEILPEMNIKSRGRFKIPLPDTAANQETLVSPIPIADGLCLVLGKRFSALNLGNEIEFEVLPTRMILKLQIVGNQMEVWYLDAQSLQKNLEKGVIHLSHGIDPSFLVFASTQELHQFFETCEPQLLFRLFTQLGSYQRSLLAEEIGS